jgi:uncharacterized tellurite resistance protein B-like protein
MKRLPPDSPEAAARTVAMVMLADSEVAPTELESLDRLGICARLGLSRLRFEYVLADCRAELRRHSAWGGKLLLLDCVRIDAMLDAVADPAARARAFACMQEIAVADGRVCDGEATVLGYVRRRWALASMQPVTA